MSDEPPTKKRHIAPTKPERDPPSAGEVARRPTKPPPGDPIAFARQIMGARKATPADRRAQGRAPQPTLTDEAELEDARVRSMKLSEPPVTTTNPSLLSLANAHASGSQGAVGEPPNAPPAATPVAPVAAPKGADASAQGQVGEMRDRFSLGDYSGALIVAEAILESDGKHAEARQVVQHCRRVLEQMYIARIGPLTRVPTVAVPRDQLRWLSIDHRAGFLLSHIDGVSTLEMILDVSGMSPLDALRILYELAQQRVITFK
ncbi:MAG: hypothetical protein ACRELY_20460 [Polyangiaceae bacterium]